MMLMMLWGCGTTVTGSFEAERAGGGVASGTVAIDDHGCYLERADLDFPGQPLAAADLDGAVCTTSQGVTRGDGGALWLSYEAGPYLVELELAASIDGDALILGPVAQ